jgi:hypothetical protein
VRAVEIVESKSQMAARPGKQNPSGTEIDVFEKSGRAHRLKGERSELSWFVKMLD